jgi:hypothetical protein
LKGKPVENEATRVSSGAQLLDESAPGWHRLIDLDRLDLSSCNKCVCGQLGRQLGWELFPGMNDFPEEFGFEIHFDADERPTTDGEVRALYRRLDEEWFKAVQTRLAFDRLPANKRAKEKITA